MAPESERRVNPLRPPLNDTIPAPETTAHDPHIS